MGSEGAELTTVRTFFGGQGSGNTGGWAPDSTKFAWTEYEKIHESASERKGGRRARAQSLSKSLA
jgi:hypothetical protein